MNDVPAPSNSPDPVETVDDSGRATAARSALQTLLMVSACVEAEVFVPILLPGAPPAF